MRKRRDGKKTEDRVSAEARRARALRRDGYRERALRLLPWICAKCAREFGRDDLHLLTVHHKDHDHRNNPEDGSNWELLCTYCHDDEHDRKVVAEAYEGRRPGERGTTSTYRPFADLDKLLGGDEP